MEVRRVFLPSFIASLIWWNDILPKTVTSKPRLVNSFLRFSTSTWDPFRGFTKLLSNTSLFMMMARPLRLWYILYSSASRSTGITASGPLLDLKNHLFYTSDIQPNWFTADKNTYPSWILRKGLESVTSLTPLLVVVVVLHICGGNPLEAEGDDVKLPL